MSKDEIVAFENFWGTFTKFFYQVIDFLKKAFPDIADKIDKIVPVYPED